MTAKDRYTAKLLCPTCGRADIVHLSENDGWSFSNGSQRTSVDHMPEGFKAVRGQGKPGDLDVYCIKCDVPAVD